MLPDIDQLLDPNVDSGELRGEQTHDLEQLKSALAIAQEIKSEQVPFLLRRLAKSSYQAGQYQQAFQYATTIVEICDNSDAKIEALLINAVSAAQVGNLKVAENSFHLAANLSRSQNKKNAEATALHNLASSVFLIRGQFSLAIAYAEQANALFNQINISHWGWPWLRTFIYLTQGDRRRARNILYEMSNEVSPATRIAGAYYFLWAHLAIDEEEYDKANEYLRLGLRIALQTGAPDLNLWLRIEHSRCYRSQNETATAREWAEEALRHSQRLALPYFEGLSNLELAQVYWQGKQELLACETLDKAMSLFQQLGADYQHAYAVYLRSLWSHQQQSRDADANWIEAATLISNSGYAFILEKDQERAFHLVATRSKNGSDETNAVTDLLLENLARVQPQSLRIVCLGRFAVWKGRQLIPGKSWKRRKSGELFRFLLLQPGRKAGREAVMEALWPEQEPDSAINLFHQSTSSLRRLLEPDLPDKFPSRYLRYEGDEVILLLPAGSIVDFEAFQLNLKNAIAAKRADLIQEAISLYAGELLPEDRYYDWTEELRSRLLNQFMEGMVTLAGLYLKQERYADALERVNQVLRLDPWNEEAVEIGMHTYTRLGSVPHALRLYNQLADTLLKDLGISPRNELRSLVDSLKRNR